MASAFTPTAPRRRQGLDPRARVAIAAAGAWPRPTPTGRSSTFARADFEDRVSPNIRRITQAPGVTTKDIYALFPKAPGAHIAKIAGLPKPAGLPL
jgi:hypothetical protein